MPGITPEGFDVKPLDQILNDMQNVQQQGISLSLDFGPTSILGIINGIIGQALYEGWQRDQQIYDGMDPEQATDDQLTSLALITGTVRELATKTQVLGCTVNVDAGFSAAPGTMFASVVGSNNTLLFTNKATVTNAGGSPANVTADFEAVTAGAIQCLASTLTVIAQPLTGWNTITNPTDGTIGSAIENDAQLRLRRDQELSAAGASTADAIKADVLAQMQPPTTSSSTLNCTVLHNDTDTVDANGLPAHSIEVIAYQPGSTGADDSALAQLILDQKGAGIETYGLSSATAKDSEGNSETIKFTRPTTVRIYISFTAVTDPNTFPADGATQLKQALVDYAVGSQGNPGAWTPGTTAYALHTQLAAFKVTGVLDVTNFKIDTVSPPVASSNIPITVRQIATLSTGDITVTVT